MARIFKSDLETNKPSDDENIRGQIDPFDRAIPGQSLIEEPGKGSFERPPTLETPEEALQFALDRMQQPDSFKESVMLMQQGVSIESMVKTLTFTMFRGGLITPDLMMIIQPYLFMWLMGRARDHKITPILFDSHDDERLPVFSSMSKTMTPEKAESIIGETDKFTDEVEPRETPDEVQAFMAMEGKEMEQPPMEEPPIEEEPMEQPPINLEEEEVI